MTPPPNPPLTQVAWQPCWRVIPTCYPRRDLYERIAEPDDLDLLTEIEQITNPRARHPTGGTAEAYGDWLINAPFIYLNPDGSRFSDGSYGVYYTAYTLKTAIAETRHHRQVFFGHTDQPPAEIKMRVVAADLSAALHDITHARFRSLHHPDSYGASQAFAKNIRDRNAKGLLYNSVRHPGGRCAALFTPDPLCNGREERLLGYRWDGAAITDVYEIHPIA